MGDRGGKSPAEDAALDQTMMPDETVEEGSPVEVDAAVDPPSSWASIGLTTDEVELGETVMPDSDALSDVEHDTIQVSPSEDLLSMLEQSGREAMGETVAVEDARRSANDLFAVAELQEAHFEGLDIRDELDRGGMGAILRAEDPKLRREVAVKVIRAGANASEAQRLRFIEEAQVTAQLEHPNVVPVHGFGVTDGGQVYFTMKLVRGESLESILERRREGDAEALQTFGLRKLLDVFLDVCQAIEYAHSKGVVHRDLKPANIMVGDFGEVLVMDWGLAKVKGRAELPVDVESLGLEAISTVRSDSGAHETVMGAVMGTPAYMSPEQAAGHNELIDERTDIYALGVILYEMLCDQPPFDAKSAVKLMRQVITRPPTPPSELRPERPISPALEALTLEMLEKEHARRTLTLDQVRAQIRDVIEGIETNYRPETTARKIVWSMSAALFFVFLVWYLTGQSVTGLLYPPLVLNAVGWFLLAIMGSYPLWAFASAYKTSLGEHERFRAPDADAIVASGFYRHRRLSAAIAPIFQLGFLVEMALWFAPILVDPRHQAAGVIHGAAVRLRGDVYQSLIVPLVFLFIYLYLQMGEVRLARRIGRYEPLLRRSRWEWAWPVFLIAALVTLVGSLDFVDWVVDHGELELLVFLEEELLGRPLDAALIMKTIVFQGSFLLLFLAMAILLVFPFPEVLAALRMPYQPSDEAYVLAHQRYFLRSLALFRVMAMSSLYGGALIGCLTAMTVLEGSLTDPLLERSLYILGPSLIGLAGFLFWRWYIRRYVASTPALDELLDERVARSRLEERRQAYRICRESTWTQRLSQLVAPAFCFIAYALWETGGETQDAQELLQPMAALGFYQILPFVLLTIAVIVRAPLYAAWLEQRVPELSEPQGDEPGNP